jgi:hypothetical protein
MFGGDARGPDAALAALHRPPRRTERPGPRVERQACPPRRLRRTTEKLGPWDGGKIERKHGHTAGHLALTPDGPRTTLWPRLAVKRQDGTWVITADVTYHLEDDILATSSEPATPLRTLPDAPPAAASPVAPTATSPLTWRAAVEASPLWPAGACPARDLAARLADLCWQHWEAAENELPGDPWRDDQLPLRILARLAALQPGDLRPEETALLLLAPLVQSEESINKEPVIFAGDVPLRLSALARLLSAPPPRHRPHRRRPEALTPRTRRDAR